MKQSIIIILLLAMLGLPSVFFGWNKILVLRPSYEQRQKAGMSAGGVYKASTEGEYRFLLERDGGDTSLTNDLHPASLFVKQLIDARIDSSPEALMKRYCAEHRDIAAKLLPSQKGDNAWLHLALRDAAKRIDVIASWRNRIFARLLIGEPVELAYVFIFGQTEDDTLCEIPPSSYDLDLNQASILIMDLPLAKQLQSANPASR